MKNDVKLSKAAKESMDPFGRAFYAYDLKVEELVAEMGDKEVLALQRSFAKLTTTNCWYATYHARPHVLECISRELYQRQSRELEKENQ